jgi:3-deoxy-D-arabino-heptulosonate 7-phosphate (DAHP) synthase
MQLFLGSLQGGAYKPRTSPYDFQGLGLEALKILREAREQSGLPVVTEVMSTEDVDTICEYVDMLQVGRAICRTSRCCGVWLPSTSQCC